MDENQIFEEINGLLEETDYPLEIRNVADLEEFLNDDNNRGFEVYEEIERLYDDLVYRDDE